LGFWSELRRRHVFRVAAGYAVVGWLLVQAAGAFEAGLNLPAWFDTVVIGFLALGFPVALVLAWAFELTPEGVKRTAPAAPDGSAPAPLARTDLALVAALVAMLGVALYQIARPTAAPATAAASGSTVATGADALSIAVLPFADMSPLGDQEYFSDGISEELLNQLAQVDGLFVISRTSSFAFKGRNTDAREIGAALGARHLLEGSVRKDGARVRITAQLIDAESGGHVWSETYDRELRDVFSIQDEIARAVTERLIAALGVTAATVRVGGTTDPDAYDVFLLARDWRNRAGPDNARHAAELYREALALDPDFALAWVELAQALEGVANFSINPEDLLAEAGAAADRAAAIAPDMWEAHEARGRIATDIRDWRGAERAFARAWRTAPSEERICIDAYLPWAAGGDPTAFIACQLTRRRSDPLSMAVSEQLQTAYFFVGDEAGRAAEYERSLSLAAAPGPTAELFELLHAWLYGDRSERGAHMDRFLEAGGPFIMPVLEDLADVLDDEVAAIALLKAAAADPAYRDQAYLSGLATWLALMGDAETAADLLHRAYVDYGRIYYTTLWARELAEMRRLPAFKEIVSELGMVDYWRESGNWAVHCRPLGDDDFACG
jgi:TolB-like protein